jgi:hypothetical protein
MKYKFAIVFKNLPKSDFFKCHCIFEIKIKSFIHFTFDSKMYQYKILECLLF